MMTAIKNLWSWGMNLSLRGQVLASGLFAVLLIASAFTLEYGFHVKPCHLCWMQRYGHWAMAGFGLAGGLLGGMLPIVVRLGYVGVVGSALYGLGYGVYQVLVQYKFLPAPQGCNSANIEIPANIEDFMAALKNPVVAPPCDQIDFTIWGITLAGWNAILMAIMLIVLVCAYCKGCKKSKESK